MNDGPSPIGPPNIKQIVKEESVFNQKNTELKNIKCLILNQNLVFRFSFSYAHDFAQPEPAPTCCN